MTSLSHPEPTIQQQQISQDESQQDFTKHHASLPAEPTLTMKNYDMYYTTSMSNLRLHLGSPDTPAIYYVQGAFSLNGPQIRLRLGTSKSDPMVAFARVHFTSRHMTLGTGDFERDPETNLAYEELYREQSVLRKGDYEFSTSTGQGSRSRFQWKKDRMPVGKTIYDCIDEKGVVVARMLSGGVYNWRKGGEIKVVEGLDQRLEELLITSALAIWIWEAGGSVLQGYE